MKNLRVQRLEISNFLRVRSVTIVPDKNIVRIKGRNKAGKSSVLRAIQSALGGKKSHPARPVHDGTEEATVKIDLGEYLVEATWKAEDRCELVVRTPDGARVRSPQAVLDGFCAKISFDPLSFMRQDAKTQVEVLRHLSGVDFTALEQERATLYASRTDVGRDRDKAFAQGAGAIFFQPPVEVSLADLTAQIQAVSDAESEVTLAARQVADEEKILESHRAEVVRLRAALKAAESFAEKVAGTVDAARIGFERAKAALATMGHAAELRAKLKTAEADNARARDLAARKTKALEGAALAKQYEALSESIDAIDAKKRRLVAGAQLPVEGLDFTGEEVTFSGLPLSQASDREQVLISAAIGHSLNPKLAALLIREGAFLDEDGWLALTAWAEERDVQVWIEDVGTDGTGILIEDGMVIEGDPLAEGARARATLPAASHGGMDGSLPPEVSEAEAMLLDDEDEA